MTLFLLSALGCTRAVDAPLDTLVQDSQDTQPTDTQNQVLGNVLIVIADDVGMDSAPCYGLSSDPVRMPNVEALCESCLLYTSDAADE